MNGHSNSGGDEAAGEHLAAEGAAGMEIPPSLRVPPPSEIVGQAFPHRDPLVVAGNALICECCRAGEDWLILMVQGVVYVRCRCGHEWDELGLTAAWFDANKGGPAVEYHPSGESAVQSLGFDGTFQGIYF